MARSKYETHVLPKLDLIKDWRQSGKTERQIAELLNIHYSSVQKYKDMYNDFKIALQASKEKLVYNLKKSLYEEALGYNYEETEKLIEKVPFLKNRSKKIIEDGDIMYKEKQKIRKVTKKARSVPSLLMFALCNLAPDQFKRQDREVEEQIEEITNDIRELKDKYSDDLIKKAFDVMYPNVSEKIKEMEDKIDAE